MQREKKIYLIDAVFTLHKYLSQWPLSIWVIQITGCKNTLKIIGGNLDILNSYEVKEILFLKHCVQKAEN